MESSGPMAPMPERPWKRPATGASWQVLLEPLTPQSRCRQRVIGLSRPTSGIGNDSPTRSGSVMGIGSRVTMTVDDETGRDWSYREARRRLVQAASWHLRRHTASGRLDDLANRIVDCSCGWTGNPLGWIGHLDHVVGSSVDGERAAIRLD